MKGSRLTVISHFLRAKWRWRTLHGPLLEHYQDHMARRTVEYARLHSPYYRRLFAGASPEEWKTLPTTDKASMMAGFDEFNTQGVSREEALSVALRAETTRDFLPTVRGLTVGLSSGTSGHRGLFLVSPWEQAAWAGTILARALPPLRVKGYSVALFHRSNSNLYEQIDSKWLRLRYYDLMMPLEEVEAVLNGTLPDILIGPPSFLVLLARRRRNGSLRSRPLRIYSAAEVLEAQDQQEIEHAFEVPARQIYQCTEGFLAISCDSLSLHLQEDLAAIQTEPLSEEGDEKRVTPIVTDLWRRTQPIIRYRLNDVLTLDPLPCACGSSFRSILRIEGRCDDVCYFMADGGALRPFFPDTIRRMVLLASDLITDYRAIQERPGSLRIHLKVNEGAAFSGVAANVRDRVAEALKQYECHPGQITIEKGLPEDLPRAKRRRVQRLG